MDKQEILKGNRLIVEFMYPQRDKRHKNYPFPFTVIEVVPEEDIIGYGKVPAGEIKHFSGSLDMMKYHSSWDWLMPVVNKCYKLSKGKGWSKSNCLEHILNSSDFMADTSISLIFEAVVNFIEWYNKQLNK